MAEESRQGERGKKGLVKQSMEDGGISVRMDDWGMKVKQALELGRKGEGEREWSDKWS